MVFALGGAAALAEIERRTFDVVVSDMRMPGIDGAALLTQVKQRHPRTVRMVLSGQTDMETAMRSVFVAHQFLSKPCDADTVRGAVDRACKLNNMLQSDALREIAGDVSMLPSSPGTYLAITQALANAKMSMADVARIAERDSGLCAKILQVANSAFFGIGRKISSVTDAATYLGAVTLKNLALALDSFSHFDKAGALHADTLRMLQLHSLSVGLLARQFIATTDKKRADEAFVAGMLHDIGHVVLATRQVGTPSPPGVDHAALGAYLLGIWGLPMPVIEAVAHHEDPGAIDHATFEIVDAVHLADRLVTALCHMPFEPEAQQVDVARLERLGISPAQIALWEAAARERVTSAPLI